MNWTTDTPTEPGYYYVKPPYAKKESLINVFGILGLKKGGTLFTPWDCGASVTEQEVFPLGTKWFGPINIPTPETKIQLQLWLAMDGNGSVALFESEPEWIEKTQNWVCDMTGVLEFSFPLTDLQGLAPGQKRKVSLTFED